MTHYDFLHPLSRVIVEQAFCASFRQSASISIQLGGGFLFLRDICNDRKLKVSTKQQQENYKKSVKTVL